MAGGGGGADDGSTYTLTVGSIYIFNLIVGAGALSMPQAFYNSGYAGGSVLIGMLALMSYMTVSMMNEAMSIANAFLPDAAVAKRARQQQVQNPDNAPLLRNAEAGAPPSDAKAKMYGIHQRVEMAAMAKMFFSKMGMRFFYLVIIVYLYGDLCIYAAAVPASLRAVACHGLNSTGPDTGNSTRPCLGPLDEQRSYYVFLTLFAFTLGPFCFFNVTKTKWLQLFTTAMRWITFIMLIAIAIWGIASRQGFTPDSPRPPESSQVPAFGAEGLAQLFGVSIYSFMCHHSLPSLVTPIANKRNLSGMLAVVFLLILSFYSLLCLTAVFRFPASEFAPKSAALYTLLFQDFSVVEISYFLALFPVFTLSANFPIIAITLRNNLALLFKRERPYPAWVDKYVWPILAIGPPIIVAFFTDDVGFLVSFTGSYAGVGIQYVIPALLCYYGRKKAAAELGTLAGLNPHEAWFKSTKWIVFVLCWSVACVGLVTFNHVYFAK